MLLQRCHWKKQKSQKESQKNGGSKEKEHSHFMSAISIGRAKVPLQADEWSTQENLEMKLNEFFHEANM